MTDNLSADPARGLYQHRITVLFGDCDPAKIVYFPRFFAFFHDAMECWLPQGLGFDYAESIHTRGIGFPAVHSEADFRAPCRHGEALVVGLRLAAIGNRSFTLSYRVWGADEPERVRVQGQTVCAPIDLREGSPSHGKAVGLPPDLRLKFASFGTSQWHESVA